MKRGIQIEKVSFKHGPLKVLDEVEAHFKEGQLSIVLGRNGSGKSTLFKILAGLEKSYEGEVWIGDLERRTKPFGNKKGIRVGFMSQFHQTTFPYTVRDLVLTGRASFSNFGPQKEDVEQVEAWLRSFDLWHLKDQPYTSLSGGERQLVLLSRVLVQQPDVLLLDEPTNHLDLNYQIKVMDCIRHLADQDILVVCVMHDPNLALLYGDDFYVMENQQLMEITHLESNALKERLEQVYRISLEALSHQNKTVFMPVIKR